MRAAKSIVVLVLLALLGYGVFALRSGPGKAAKDSPSPNPESDTKSVPPTPAESNPVIATVGPLEIHLKDLTGLSVQSEAAAENLKETSGSAESRLRIRRRFLDEMIERRLLVLGSAKHPEWVSDASWEAEVQRRLVEIGPAELERRRALSGIPKEDFFADFRKHVREEMMKAAILEREVDAKVEVSEEELKRRYETDRETAFYRPPAWGLYRFARLVARDRKPDPAELEKEVGRIRDRVAAEIASATDPHGMAKKMADTLQDLLDPETDEAGHAYVYDTPKADFDPALKASLRTCAVGDLSPVFELAGDRDKMGYCFYLSYAHRPEEQAPFERVRHVLQGRIREERKEERTHRLFERLKQEFPVEIRSDLLSLDPPLEESKENSL